MTAHENPTPALEGLKKSHSLGQRLARLLLGAETGNSPRGGRRLAAWLGDERGSVGEDVIPSFPIVRQGYDIGAVDAYVGELERDVAELDRELVALRAQVATPGDVVSEIKRIGEQTSSVLIAAHEQQEAILRAAREGADGCVAEATARANAITAHATTRVKEMTEAAEARVRELEAEVEAMHRMRDRLLEDARTVSSALAAVADTAQERVPVLTPSG